MPINVGIIGVGGVGGYFGGKLCKYADTHKASVHFIARGDHLAAIQCDGLHVNTSDEGDWVCQPESVSDNFEALPTLDVCLLCVKSYDLNDVLFHLSNRITDNTMILPLLNGMDIYERIRGVITNACVFPACVYVGTHIEAPGRVTQRGGACTIHFGRDPNKPDYVPNTIFELFDKSTIKYEWHNNDYTEIWRKFIFIASFGLVTAVYGKTIGEVLDTPELSDQTASVIREIVAVSRRKGIELSSSVVDNALWKGRDFPHETKTSFQRDFERGDKLDERDLFGGSIVRMAAQYGIDVPMTIHLYDKLNAIKPQSNS